MPLRRGDIVLVPFPFTDLSSQKVRPAVVVSPEDTGDDVLLAFISSVPTAGAALDTDLPISMNHPEFKDTGLKKYSIIKASKLLTLHKEKILRRLGHIGPALSQELDLRLKRAVGLKT